jgi:uncharacterized lipoprotein YmbA
MKLSHTLRFTTLAAGLLTMGLSSGCLSRSPEARTYVTSSSDGWRALAARDEAACAYSIRVAPVDLAAYLDRPEIVTRASGIEIQKNALQRWGIPLDVVIDESVSLRLAQALPDAFVDVFSDARRQPSDYLVNISVVRLDGYLGGEVELIAQWSVVRAGAGAKPAAQRVGRYTATAGEKSIEAYVQAVENVLSDLGDDIAATVKADRTAKP